MGEWECSGLFADGVDLRTAALTMLPFLAAATAWLETRRPYISERTFSDYQFYLKTLAAFFGETKLTEVTPDHIRAYQKMRMVRAGASAINKECSVLQQMLKRIGRWAELAQDYQPLRLPRESPHRPLTSIEERKLYQIGPTNPAWEVAYCAFVISMNTTAGPGELRHLRLMDVDLTMKTIRIQPEGAKNEGRIRVIPLNELAFRAISYLLERAKRLGSIEPHHYLIPRRIKKGTYDPEQPAMGWRTAHNAMCMAAGLDITPYCFRHHPITKMLENPEISEETVEAMAGHLSHKMKKRYSHIRIDAKRKAVEALGKIGPKFDMPPIPQKTRA